MILFIQKWLADSLLTRSQVRRLLVLDLDDSEIEGSVGLVLVPKLSVPPTQFSPMEVVVFVALVPCGAPGRE